MSLGLKRKLSFLRSSRKKNESEDRTDDEPEEGEDSSSPFHTETETETEIEQALGDNDSSSSSEIIERTYKPDTPVTFGAFQSQASGHSRIFAIDDEKIAKPCNPHESQVYHQLVEDDVVGAFVPYFYGVIHVEPDEDVEVRYFQKAGECTQPLVRAVVPHEFPLVLRLLCVSAVYLFTV